MSASFRDARRPKLKSKRLPNQIKEGMVGNIFIFWGWKYFQDHKKEEEKVEEGKEKEKKTKTKKKKKKKKERARGGNETRRGPGRNGTARPGREGKADEGQCTLLMRATKTAGARLAAIATASRAGG